MGIGRGDEASGQYSYKQRQHRILCEEMQAQP